MLACLPQTKSLGPPRLLQTTRVPDVPPEKLSEEPSKATPQSMSAAAVDAPASPHASVVLLPAQEVPALTTDVASEPTMPPLPPGLRDDWFEYLVTQAPSRRELRRVSRAFNRGAANYRLGKYDIARLQLQNALSSTKFNVATYLTAAAAEASVLLGKMALLQSVARADSHLHDEAQCWFWLAQRLDPQMAEATLLLQLLQTARLP